MNNNPLLGQVLGGLFGQAMARRGGRGGSMGGGGLGAGLGGGLGGAALGSILGGMLGGARRGPMGGGGLGGLGGNRGTLVMLLLPFVMRWVQQNGGIGAVLKRFQQKGYTRQAQSWVDVGQNEALDAQAVEQVIGPDELSQLAQRFGVPQQDVAQAVAEIMPEMVDQLSPEGQVPAQADEVLGEGASELEREIERLTGKSIDPGQG